MKKHLIEFNKLKDGACSYMEKIKFSDQSIYNHDLIWRHLRAYMYENNLKSYKPEIGENFINHFMKSKVTKDNAKYRKKYSLIIRRLNEFSEDSKITIHKRSSRFPLKHDGPIGTLINDFLLFLENEKRSIITIRRNSSYLYSFMNYCDNKKVTSPDSITLHFIIVYINIYKSDSKISISCLVGVLRNFTRFLFLENIIKVNVSKKIPSVKNIQPKLPSVYSEKEINQLISSIDRSTSIGKRNFSMILLAARLGLRSSDIADLKLKEIQWEKNIIKINQYKTSRLLILPLTSEVGNAIIDYLKYGRPKCNSLYVFIQSRPPFEDKMTSKSFTQVVRGSIANSGLNTTNRKSGAHVLRHSLASRILEKNKPIYVLKEVLGHHDLNSTKFYIRIDTKSLETCTLDVPPIDSSFYEQGGGRFYG
ncbi:site-specific integrase [Cellulophaga baltica]|uniref:site-specific integrase n=1 Tax=Cellulophaga baltica TaxID=76594 RepID=UPI002495A763|nr:site-specific integrase [Cellulophaga baltica]